MNPEERRMLKQAKAAIREQQYETAYLLLNGLIEMEPHSRPVRRLMRVAMGGLEEQQRAMGDSWHPVSLKARELESPADTDDLISALDLATPKAAQNPQEDIKTWDHPESMVGGETK
jgi:hypothetical protein